MEITVQGSTLQVVMTRDCPENRIYLIDPGRVHVLPFSIFRIPWWWRLLMRFHLYRPRIGAVLRLDR